MIPALRIGSIIQAPYSGNGYAGIVGVIQAGPPSGNVYEGLLQNFSTPLVAGKVYYEEMYVSLAEMSTLGSTIGFTSFPIGGANDYYHPSNITDNTNWTKVSHCFTADGSEVNRAITWNGSSLPPVPVVGATGYPFSNPQYPTSYFYIDDVSLRPLAYAGPSITACNFATIGCTSLPPIAGATYSWTVSGPAGAVIISPASQSTNVTFTTAGTYTFTITATLGSCQDSDVMTVTVVNPITSSFVFNPDPACVGETISFTATDPNILPGDIVSWDFGDGNFSSGVSASHQYQVPGTYTVTCCVTNACGTTCTSLTITILDASPCFTWSGTCIIHFQPFTTCDNLILSETWDFGDGSPMFTQHNPPAHLYPLNNFGYVVVHTITTANGTYTCTMTVIQQGPPAANISGYQTNNCGNGTLTYTANPCDPGIVYTWTVIGGTPSSGTGCSININWSTSGGSVILNAWDPVDDCSSNATLIIPECCEGTGLRIDNMTASQAILLYGNPISAPSIYITGVFTVDVPITFQNCDVINIQTNTPINILPNQNLTFDNCTTETKCVFMWDGIYIPDPTATLNIINNSFIRYAKHAVVSNSGGNFFIENSTLQNNDTDIVVNTYAGIHTGIVRGTTFNMDGPMLPAIPALPANHTKTVCAIEIKNNANITIGDASQAAYKNKFDDILVGVRTRNSVTTIVNALFSNMNPTLAQLPIQNAGTGVVAIGAKGILYQPTITVGGAGLNACTFTNMVTGIDVFERHHVFATWNIITKVHAFGIRVQRSKQSTITLNNNFINNSTASYFFITGILVLECYDATVNINQNRIWAPLAAPNQTGVGIRVACVSPANVTLNIQNNISINRVKTGIWLQNLVGKNKVFVTDNVINFQKANSQYTTAHYGIRLEGCATVRCDANIVSKTIGGNPTSVMVSLLRGISIENSPVTVATNNVFTRLGSGLFGFETSSSSTLACNTMDRCYNGVFFTGGLVTGGNCDIGDQILDPNNTPASTGNIWNNTVSGTGDINGDVSPTITWRYHTVSPPTAVGTNGISLVFDPYNACGIFFLLPQQMERDKQVGAALRSAADTNTTAENRYQLHRYAHRKLTQTPAWLSLGFPDDTLYQNFYNSNNPTNIGTLRQVELAADTGGYQFVASACISLACSNTIEHNAKVVYGIYAATWMQGIMEFSSADSATLLYIALQDPVEGGTAVYSARVMLDLEIDYFGVNSQRMGKDQTSPAMQSSELNLYPNPASESVTLQYGVEEGQNAQFEIFDLSGKIVLSQQLAPQQEAYTINTMVLPGGVYMIRVLVDGEATESQRLVIVK